MESTKVHLYSTQVFLSLNFILNKFYICFFRLGHSWEWMYTDQRDPPYLMQLDCETDGGSKLQQLARFGFYFTKIDGSKKLIDILL